MGLTCHAAHELVSRTPMSIIHCDDEADLSKEQMQLNAQLRTWQQQIQQLVQREAGLPMCARSSPHGAENQAPLPAAVTAAQCESRQGSNAQAGRDECGDAAPLRNLQSSNWAPPSVQLPTHAASQDQGCQPTPCVVRDASQHASLPPKGGGHDAETRRMRMRQRLQAAEHRRRKAKEQAQVLVLPTATHLILH